MKIKISIIIICLGLFFGGVKSVDAQATTICKSKDNTVIGACVPAVGGMCPANSTEITDAPALSCSATQRCCKTSTTAVPPKPGCCVISKGNCKTVSTQAECTGAQAYDPENGCDKHKDVCEIAAVPPVTTEFVNPITPTTLEGLLTNLLSALQGVVALIAIIMIIIGGLMYMFAGVDEKMVETAKKTIGSAVIGLAIVFAAPAFLKEILTIVGGTDNSGLLAGALSLKEIAENVLNLLLSIVGILGIIGLIIGGGFYMTAYGDEDRIKKGKSIVTASLVGIIIASAALIIVKQIAMIITGK